MIRRSDRACTRALVCAASFIALSATGAAAQTAGDYVGTTQDGAGVTLTVGTDGNGATAIISASIGINATCTPGGGTFDTGWGYGQDAVITNGQFSYTESFGYLYQPVTGSFSGNTITGTILSDLPTFATVKRGAPKRSVFCTSPSQAFTATLSAAASKAPAVPFMVYGGASR